MTKYDLIFKKIRELKYQHNLDNCVFRALFDFNMENVSDKKININDKEYFTYLSGSPESKTFASFEKFSDLLKYFKKDSFTKNTSLNDLFQEVHNRYMFEQGYDVKKIVQENTQTKGMNDTIAYVCHGTSELAINYSILNHAAVLPVTKSPAINRENVGLMFLNTVCHESQHCCQFEYVLDLLMNENLDESKKFIGALMLINSTNSIFAERKNDLVYSLKDKMNYKYDYLEHDANYSAHKKVQELLNQSNEFDNENLAPYHYGASILGTRAEYIMFPNNYTKNRMSKIENFTKYQIEYFKKNIDTNCYFCKDILNIVDDYLKVDENGNSKFRDKLKHDILEMSKMQVASRQEAVNNCY